MRQWRERGIVTFERCVDEADIKALLADVEYLVENRSDFKFEIEFRGRRLNISDLEGSPFSDTGVKFNCIENISLAARRLSLSRVVCRFLRHVFQDNPVVIQSLTFWRGSEQPAHLDYPYVTVQTKLPHLAASWIPLEDVHPDAGPLAYYPGSHRAGVIAPFDWGEGRLVFDGRSLKSPQDFADYIQERIEEKNLKKEVFLPRKGDVLIWHGNVLHEGTKVNDPARTRRSYVTHYTSLTAYPREHMMPKALQKGHFITLNQGYAFDHPWEAESRRLPSWHTRPVC